MIIKFKKMAYESPNNTRYKHYIFESLIAESYFVLKNLFIGRYISKRIRDTV